MTICDVLPVTAVGKIYKPELRKRAIKAAFNTALKAAFSETEFMIHIADDKRLGIKVMLEANDTNGQDDFGSQLQEVLQHFTQHWELIDTDA